MGSFLVVLALEPSKPLLLGLSVASGSPPGLSLQRLVYSLITTARVRPPPCSQKVSSYRSPSRAASQQIAARVVGDRQRIAVASILGAKLSFEVNRENLMGNHRSQLQRGLDRPDSTSLSFPLNQSGLLEDLLDRRGRRPLDLRLTLTQPIHQRLPPSAGALARPQSFSHYWRGAMRENGSDPRVLTILPPGSAATTSTSSSSSPRNAHSAPSSENPHCVPP